MAIPTPHADKLRATLANEKLPASDKPRIQTAITRYERWISDLNAVTGSPQQRVQALVALLNEYRLYIDVDLVFDSPEDFLYRQKGQLKLDNSVIEEFLPYLVRPEILPEIVVRASISAFFLCKASMRPSTWSVLRMKRTTTRSSCCSTSIRSSPSASSLTT